MWQWCIPTTQESWTGTVERYPTGILINVDSRNDCNPLSLSLLCLCLWIPALLRYNKTSTSHSYAHSLSLRLYVYLDWISFKRGGRLRPLLAVISHPFSESAATALQEQVRGPGTVPRNEGSHCHISLSSDMDAQGLVTPRRALREQDRWYVIFLSFLFHILCWRDDVGGLTISICFCIYFYHCHSLSSIYLSLHLSSIILFSLPTYHHSCMNTISGLLARESCSDRVVFSHGLLHPRRPSSCLPRWNRC